MNQNDFDHAWNLLAVDLEVARIAAKWDREAGGHDGGRLGALFALRGVIEYFDQLGVPIERRNPLYRLFLALEDLDNGKVHDMLKPVSQGRGGAGDSIESKTAKAWAAAAMECLMVPAADGSKGLSRQAAARRVARKIAKWPVADSAGFSWRTVANWRDVANSGSEREDIDAAVYQVARAHLRQNKVSADEAFRGLMSGHGPWY